MVAGVTDGACGERQHAIPSTGSRSSKKYALTGVGDAAVALAAGRKAGTVDSWVEALPAGAERLNHVTLSPGFKSRSKVAAHMRSESGEWPASTQAKMRIDPRVTSALPSSRQRCRRDEI